MLKENFESGNFIDRENKYIEGKSFDVNKKCASDKTSNYYFIGHSKNQYNFSISVQYIFLRMILSHFIVELKLFNSYTDVTIKCYNFRDLKVRFKINKNAPINKLVVIAQVDLNLSNLNERLFCIFRYVMIIFLMFIRDL
jgi:hypothetical protein